MADRPYLAPAPVITNGDMSGNITSAVTILSQKSMISYAYSWTGSSPVGAVSVQVSNDYSVYPNGVVNNAGTWNTLTLSVDGSPATSVAVTGNTGTGFIDIDQTAAYAIRTVYAFTSGTGTLQATVHGKVT